MTTAKVSGYASGTGRLYPLNSILFGHKVSVDKLNKENFDFLYRESN